MKRSVPYETNGQAYEIVIDETPAGVTITPTLAGAPLGSWSYSAGQETASEFRHYGHDATEELLKIAKWDLDRGYAPDTRGNQS